MLFHMGCHQHLIAAHLVRTDGRVKGMLFHIGCHQLVIAAHLVRTDGRVKSMPNHLNLKIFPYGTYCGPLIDGVPDTRNNSAWQGTMWYLGGSQYEGQWKNGKMNGWGQLKTSSGDVYSGPFRDGMKDGRFDFTQHRGEKHIVTRTRMTR